jgi:hypothetical protein
VLRFFLYHWTHPFQTNVDPRRHFRKAPYAAIFVAAPEAFYQNKTAEAVFSDSPATNILSLCNYIITPVG